MTPLMQNLSNSETTWQKLCYTSTKIKFLNLKEALPLIHQLDFKNTVKKHQSININTFSKNQIKQLRQPQTSTSMNESQEWWSVQVSGDNKKSSTCGRQGRADMTTNDSFKQLKARTVIQTRIMNGAERTHQQRSSSLSYGIPGGFCHVVSPVRSL